MITILIRADFQMEISPSNILKRGQFVKRCLINNNWDNTKRMI